MNRHRKKIIVFAALVVAVLAFEVFVRSPYNKMEYQPFCWENGEDKFLKGPLRPEYRKGIIYWMRFENFKIWEEDGKLYVTRYQTVDEGNFYFPDRAEYLNNLEGKLIHNLWNGTSAGPDITPINPPNPLIEAVADARREKGMGEDEEWDWWDYCPVKRAGTLLVERMGADPAVDGEKH
ncbi:MAG: hypothetical protein H6851_00220 [Geminicoccaceae bacterium]|nr:hypothetical protein [Geminicoccaceae bacterium]